MRGSGSPAGTLTAGTTTEEEWEQLGSAPSDLADEKPVLQQTPW